MESKGTQTSRSSDELEDVTRENLRLRSRLKGVDVLSTLFREARDHVSRLNSEKNQMEIALENLQSRLHRLGADTKVDLAEHEIFMPGHDKVFLRGLLDENVRLQRALKTGVGSETALVRKEEQKERIEKLEKIVGGLTEERRAQARELQRLHDSAKASDDDKNKEIATLRERVTHLTGDRENAETICAALTESTQYLEERLAMATKDAERAKSDLRRFEMRVRREKSDKIERDLLKLKMNPTDLEPEERIDLLEERATKLELENAKLTDELKEVIGTNGKWQRYNDQREAYVIKLYKTNSQQHSKIIVLERRCSDLKREIRTLNEEFKVLKERDRKDRDAALFSADQQLQLKAEKIEELKAQIKGLRDVIQNESIVERNLSDKETIRMLEHQVNTFSCDFKIETTEKERLQRRYTSALRELREKDRLIQELRTMPRETEAENDAPYEISVDDDVVDNARLPDDTDRLECPNCKRTFRVSEQLLFTNHTSFCS